jgi:hypothetical protein
MARREQLNLPEFCPTKLDVPKVFCTLLLGHVGPCSFFLSGERSDAAIHHLRAELAKLRKVR